MLHSGELRLEVLVVLGEVGDLSVEVTIGGGELGQSGIALCLSGDKILGSGCDTTVITLLDDAHVGETRVSGRLMDLIVELVRLGKHTFQFQICLLVGWGSQPLLVCVGVATCLEDEVQRILDNLSRCEWTTGGSRKFLALVNLLKNHSNGGSWINGLVHAEAVLLEIMRGDSSVCAE